MSELAPGEERKYEPRHDPNRRERVVAYGFTRRESMLCWSEITRDADGIKTGPVEFVADTKLTGRMTELLPQEQDPELDPATAALIEKLFAAHGGQR